LIERRTAPGKTHWAARVLGNGSAAWIPEREEERETDASVTSAPESEAGDESSGSEYEPCPDSHRRGPRSPQPPSKQPMRQEPEARPATSSEPQTHRKGRKKQRCETSKNDLTKTAHREAVMFPFNIPPTMSVHSAAVQTVAKYGPLRP